MWKACGCFPLFFAPLFSLYFVLSPFAVKKKKECSVTIEYMTSKSSECFQLISETGSGLGDT